MAKPSPRPELLNIIRSVRNRWRLRRLMYALALLLAAGVVLLLLTALLLDYFRFAPGPTRLLQFGAYTAFLVLALSLLLRPLWRRVSGPAYRAIPGRTRAVAAGGAAERGRARPQP